MNYLNQINNALLGPAGKPPPPAIETIQKITDRLTQSALLSDRRAAVLSLKGLSRDWKQAVGEHSLLALISVLQVDAKEDSDIGKATLETLVILCECSEPAEAEGSKSKSKIPKDDIGLKHTDIILQQPEATHTLLYLLTQTNFYVRFTSVQLLSVLLLNRPQKVQQHFLSDPGGPSSILTILDERREIIRNEALLLTQALIDSNVDIQKALAFESIFEKLLSIISQEGGIEGGVVAQDCLIIIDGLLRFNGSNQSYFRELTLPSALPPLLLYPSPSPHPDHPTPQEFSLQFWDTQKVSNASIVLNIINILSKGKGASQRALEQSGITRCLIDLSLASNAPTVLKTEALQTLSPAANFFQLLTSYIPVPDTNGEEWDRLPEETALSAIIGIALDGEYGGIVGPISPPKEAEALELRVAAASLFEKHVYGNIELRLSLLGGAAVGSRESPPNEEVSPSLRILRVLAEPPTPPLSPSAAQSTLFASILFSSLIRSSERCKSVGQSIIPSQLSPTDSAPLPSEGNDDDDPPQSLLATLVGSVALALRSRSQARELGAASELGEWDRVIIAYLSVLCLWCWDNPQGVKEVLVEGGALGVVVEPIAQSSEVDILVQGLSAFFLGVCYEFNREAGEIDRSTLHTIIHSRIGLDNFTSRIARVRDDVRFKALSVDTPIVFFDADGYEVPADSPDARPTVWLDWTFVEFWRSNSYSIQKSVAADPDAITGGRGLDPETEAHIASLKALIRSQAQELETAYAQIAELSEQQAQAQPPPPVESPPTTELAPAPQIGQLTERIDALEVELAGERMKRNQVEKEQEDLLVLLDELNSKRRRDKGRMREQGLEVSEGEDEVEDDGENGEDEGSDSQA
ncbi:hypothetical protein BS47DRAFT_1350130 [Hydnum rufescens UP504]|uniref:General vesicular transport factor p115 n=1 Tax=Hydnum rufescens UP504 TaxID=1448309 RepID=A0A9P6AMY7_9AGAM|nr:hypothetical protein BS47DRAFT_1350130 [Hydnum rufescens UP504]